MPVTRKSQPVSDLLGVPLLRWAYCFQLFSQAVLSGENVKTLITGGNVDKILCLAAGECTTSLRK